MAFEASTREVSVSAQRGYHHGDLRNALVTAAQDLIKERGLAGLSVAEAARRAHVSGAAPYRHFASRAELLSAVATRWANELLTQLETCVPPDVRDGDDRGVAVEALVELTRQRIAMSLAGEAGFELVYAAELRDFDDADRREATRRLFELYLWPAMTITGDAEAASRLLRQAAAIAQGYVSMARSSDSPTAAQARELAQEAADAVRAVALAAQQQQQRGSTG